MNKTNLPYHAEVYLYDSLVGSLEMRATDEFVFTYNLQYLASASAVPISFSLPLQQNPQVSHTLHPFFDNLLFEGHQLREAEKAFGLSRYSVVDRFRLLLLTGRDTFSAISIQAADTEVTEQPDEVAPFQEISLKSAYEDSCPICMRDAKNTHPACAKKLWGQNTSVKIQAFEVEPMNTFRIINQGCSVSGAQRKAIFSYSNGLLTRKGTSTHMLKPTGDFSEMPANEHLTMVAAKMAGFSIPPVGLFHIEGIGLVFIIKRFDGSSVGADLVEDFAQIGGHLAYEKEEATMEYVAKIIGRYATSPVIEFNELFKRMLFCHLVGNGDMHLKNWSLRRQSATGLVKLAPVYDFTSVRTYFPQESVESILSIGGKNDGLTAQDFEKFARESLNLNSKLIATCFAKVGGWREEISRLIFRSALSEPARHRYANLLDRRFQALQF